MIAVKPQKEKRLRKGFAIKEIDGELFYCHKYRDDGRWITIKRPLKEFIELLTVDGKLKMDLLQCFNTSSPKL